MAFRKVSLDHMIRGTLLATLECLFPEAIPTLSDYAQESGVAPSTFRRAAKWLLGLLPGLFGERRPGPRSAEEERDAREEALRRLEDLRASVAGDRAETENNCCYTGEAKQRIASVAEEIQASGVLTYGEIAAVLGLAERQLLRIRRQVEAAGGAAPEAESRRPKRTGELSEKIQELIERIKRSEDDRSPYTAADVSRILNRNYRAELLEHHGSERISETTVRKYLSEEEGEEAEQETTVEEHPRGSWHYPEPFQQVAVDTSYFKLFGITFYFITVFEFGGRLNLLTRAFLRENTAAVVGVLEEYLEKFPGVEVVVIDRGTPYLNEEVKALLGREGRLRLVCPPATPTAKAAAERHFKTLKAAIRPAIEKVFPRNPGWTPARLVKVLEMGAAVFQELYHQIPQEGIDGKTPAERIESFDPVRAAASLVDLFERTKDSEPSKDYSRHLHEHFQLPGDVEETVKRLRKFSTRTLRLLFRRVSPYMGPPRPKWMHDPLGFLCAKAREIQEAEHEEFLRARHHAAVRNREREEERERLAKLRDEAHERQTHPERSLEEVLELLVRCVETDFSGGVRLLKRELGELLGALSRKLRTAFSSELRRLKARIATFTSESEVRQQAESILDELVAAQGANP